MFSRSHNPDSDPVQSQSASTRSDPPNIKNDPQRPPDVLQPVAGYTKMSCPDKPAQVEPENLVCFNQDHPLVTSKNMTGTSRNPTLSNQTYWKNRKPKEAVHWCYSSLSDKNGWWYMPNASQVESKYQYDSTHVDVGSYRYDFSSRTQTGCNGGGIKRQILRVTESELDQYYADLMDGVLRNDPVWVCIIGNSEIPYPPEIQRVLNANRQDSTCRFTLRNNNYTVDFKQLTQCNVRTGKIRRMRSYSVADMKRKLGMLETNTVTETIPAGKNENAPTPEIEPVTDTNSLSTTMPTTATNTVAMTIPATETNTVATTTPATENNSVTMTNADAQSNTVATVESEEFWKNLKLNAEKLKEDQTLVETNNYKAATSSVAESHVGNANKSSSVIYTSV